jgi:hypothetical protein
MSSIGGTGFPTSQAEQSLLGLCLQVGCCVVVYEDMQSDKNGELTSQARAQVLEVGDKCANLARNLTGDLIVVKKSETNATTELSAMRTWSLAHMLTRFVSCPISVGMVPTSRFSSI